MALATCGILALELSLIRWLSGQIRMFAYFNNLVLIASFLGIGLGVALGGRRPGLVHWALPLLAILSLLVTFPEEFQFYRLQFPDTAVYLWGADASHPALAFGASLLVMLVMFWLVAAIFVAAGSVVGHIFAEMRPLRAYRWDLIGSILGIGVVSTMTWIGVGPGFWLAPGCLALAALSGRLLSWGLAVAVVALGTWSGSAAVYSPYNRIDRGEQDGHVILLVNRDFHQFIHDLSERALNDPAASVEARQARQNLKLVYDLPFVVNPVREHALIVGAGTGNDVQAALRNGYRQVHSVDIDPVIIDIGRREHPEKPYSDPRVVAVVNDARAFFEQYRGRPFDVVCFGLLDSHAMFSSMSTLRLDNFVYTKEAIRSAWKNVSPRGHLTVCFSVYAGDWISDRMYWTIVEATGSRPYVVDHGLNWGRTFIVGREGSSLDLAPASQFKVGKPVSDLEQTRGTTDDWPFLYVRPGQFPLGYVVLIGLVLVTGVLAARRVFGREMTAGGFDPPLFLMGAAFLLIETRGVTNLSLLFGSTWLVNSAVFLGILLMALAANTIVEVKRPRDLRPWFVLVLASVIMLWVFPVGSLNRFDLATRGLVGGLVNALPIGFAGVVFSLLLSRSSHPGASLGSNLMGALAGGCLEYASMWMGLRAMAAAAFVIYAAAFLLILLGPKRVASPASPGLSIS